MLKYLRESVESHAEIQARIDSTPTMTIAAPNHLRPHTSFTSSRIDVITLQLDWEISQV